MGSRSYGRRVQLRDDAGEFVGRARLELVARDENRGTLEGRDHALQLRVPVRDGRGLRCARAGHTREEPAEGEGLGAHGKAGDA